MTSTHSPPVTILLASLFKRLETIEAILRIILSEAKISALLTFRGEPEKRVLLDYSKSPALVLVDSRARTANIFVTINGDVMHEVFLGRMHAGKALGRRELLLRGSAVDLAKFIPLFDFAPLLYREHLADIGLNGFARPSGIAPAKESVMNGRIFNGDPIPLTRHSAFERLVIRFFNGAAYLAGYLVGTVRHRLFTKLSLFEVLSSMSRGLTAAAPSIETEAPGGE